MSKGNTKQTEEVKEGAKFSWFINSQGMKFMIAPVPPYLISDINSEAKHPAVPTYTVATAGGGSETYPYDEKSIETASPEDKAKWQEYLDEDNAVQTALSERVLTAILIEGVVIEDPDDLEKWKSRRRLMKLSVPEDEEELMLVYKRTKVIRDKDDIQNILTAVMKLTGISKEAVDAALSSFPDKLESIS